MIASLDHVLVHTSEIESGTAALRALSDVELTRGGHHPAQGTVNALASMGDSYLELIAKQAPTTSVDALNLIQFAMRTDDIGAAAAAALDMGLTIRWMDGQRKAPDGGTLAWRMLDIGGHRHAGTVPFFIDWGATQNPAESAAPGLSDPVLTIFSPEAAELRSLYRRLGIDLAVEDCAKRGLRLDVNSPRGRLCLLGDGCGWMQAFS